MENCFSIQLYSFQIFPPREANPPRCSFPLSREFFFMFFLPFFSFHSTENHLNIIVIFLQPSASHPLLPHSSRIYTIHIYTKWMDFSFLRDECGKSLLLGNLWEAICVCMRLVAWKWRGFDTRERRATRKKKSEIMLPGLNNRVICHFSPFKYDDTIIMSIPSFFSFCCRNTMCARRYKKTKNERSGNNDVKFLCAVSTEFFMKKWEARSFKRL